MRLALHTVICCCIFTTVMPLDRGASEELDTSLKKRFRVWLMSRMKRDLPTASEEQFGVRPGTTVSPPPSLELNVRPRRSTSSKSSGCHFITCVYHELVHRLHENGKVKCEVPKRKMTANGYGRRRRRSQQDAAQQVPQTAGDGRSVEADQAACRH